MNDKKINVAYNWIGPKGPVPNTEVPNVLNLAAITESASTDSHHFWCDSVWHLIFCNKEGYDLSPTTYLNSEDLFIYPLPVTWRINFSTYFHKNGGILEYSHTNGQVMYLIRQCKGFILIEDAAEAHVEPSHIRSMHTYFTELHIPMNKIIYLTGCMNAQALYDEWCLLEGITEDRDKMNLFSYPTSQNSLASYFKVWKPEIPEYDTERVPEKLFLSWNRRFRPHRTAMAFGLDKLGLVDRSYLSMNLTDTENSSVHITHTFQEHLLYKSIPSAEDKLRFVRKLPLVLDGENDVNQMCQDFNDATRPYYQNSLVSLVSETNFTSNEVSLTEKSFKPVKEKHPFITVGVNGTLRALKEMGFKTFGEFWDEGYDTIVNPADRMAAILDICTEISTWDNAKIIDFRRRVKPILDHNYEILKIEYSHIVAARVRQRILEITGTI
jgi:hypothetical protein